MVITAVIPCNPILKPHERDAKWGKPVEFLLNNNKKKGKFIGGRNGFKFVDVDFEVDDFKHHKHIKKILLGIGVPENTRLICGVWSERIK
jgi:hypothetical protein